ncbi:Alpha/Beta hydrolase protein [Aspergillus carlsbadensis]|nr:Alpha/Beta hydrolase protein [Aspergillus carlsbadensis]
MPALHSMCIFRSITLALLASAMPSSVRCAYNSNAVSGESSPKTVSFPCGTDSIAGHLYLPDNYDSTQRYPAVVVGGSFTSVKEMMGGTYAGEMARQGIIALSIDYRNYGQSDGAIRQYEDPASKAADLSAAVEYLVGRPDVAGTGLLGVCTSGGTVLYPAATDPRVKAVATVVGFFQSPAITRILHGGEEGIMHRQTAGQQAQQVYNNTGEIHMIRAYGGPPNATVNPGPQVYYDDPLRGGGVSQWRNEFAVASWGPWLEFDPVSQAAHVTAPTLMIHSEDAAFPDQARAVYNNLGPKKQIIWTNGTHYDFYDSPETVRFSADKVSEHFHAILT